MHAQPGHRRGLPALGSARPLGQKPRRTALRPPWLLLGLLPLLMGTPALGCEGPFSRGLAVGQLLPLGVDGGFVASQEVQALQQLSIHFTPPKKEGPTLQALGLLGGAVARLWTSTTTSDFTLEPYFEQRLWQLGLAGGVELPLGSLGLVARGRAMFQPGSSAVGNATQLQAGIAAPLCLPLGSLGMLVPALSVERTSAEQDSAESLQTLTLSAELTALGSWRNMLGVSGGQLRLSMSPALTETATTAARARLEGWHWQRLAGGWGQLRGGYELGLGWPEASTRLYHQLRLEPRAGLSFVHFLSVGVALPLSSTWSESFATEMTEKTVTLEGTGSGWLRLVPQTGWELVLTLSLSGLKATQQSSTGALYVQRTDSLWQLSAGGTF